MSTVPTNLNHVESPNPEENGVRRSVKMAPWIFVLAICCAVAISISGYLTWTSLTSSKIAGCGGGVFDCSHVTNSKWSLWMGLPVSALAILSYLSLGTALIFAVTHTSAVVKRLSWTAVAMFALSAGLAAIWFTGLQAFALGHYCSYCLTAHACGLIAAAIAIWKIPNRVNVMKYAAPFATAGIAVLMAGQIFQSEPEKFQIQTFDAAPAASEAFEAPVDSLFEPPMESAETDVFEAPVANAKQISSTNMLVNLMPAERLTNVVSVASTMLAFTSPLQSGNSSGAGGSKTTAGSGKKLAAKSGAKPADEAKAKTKERRTVGINGGTIKLDVKQWPLNGSADAKHVFVEMLDYNCPNCRKTHKAISGAKKMLGGDVAVMILPIPLNTACNSAVTTTHTNFVESCDIAKLAIAVWRVDAKKFSQFHEAMLADEQAPTFAEATEMAKSMVDGGKLDAEIASGVPAKYITSMVQLYERAGKGTVPKLMFPTTSIIGEFNSAESLVDVIKQQTK